MSNIVVEMYLFKAGVCDGARLVVVVECHRETNSAVGLGILCDSTYNDTDRVRNVTMGQRSGPGYSVWQYLQRHRPCKKCHHGTAQCAWVFCVAVPTTQTV